MIHTTPAWQRICDSLACPPGTISITLSARFDESIRVRCEHYADADNGDLEIMIAEYFIRAGHGPTQSPVQHGQMAADTHQATQGESSVLHVPV